MLNYKRSQNKTWEKYLSMALHNKKCNLCKLYLSKTSGEWNQLLLRFIIKHDLPKEHILKTLLNIPDTKKRSQLNVYNTISFFFSCEAILLHTIIMYRYKKNIP